MTVADWYLTVFEWDEHKLNGVYFSLDKTVSD